MAVDRILALQLKRIGDVILTLPALAALRQSQPETEVSAVLVDGCAALAPLLPQGVKPLFYRRGKMNFGLWREIVSNKFTHCYDFTGSDRSTLMARLSGADQKISYRKALEKKPARGRVFNEVCEASVRNHHTIDYHLELIDKADVQVDFQPDIPEATRQVVDVVLEDAEAGDSFVVVHPGTARDEKYWPVESWAAVIDHLSAERGLRVLITGSPDVREQEHLSAIKARLSAEVADVSGKVDLVGLTELLRRSQLVLGVDSAAMHLAALFQRPEIALFGPTNPFHWRPLHSKAQILLAGHEAPVENFEPRHKAAPMHTLSIETVIRAISSALD